MKNVVWSVGVGSDSEALSEPLSEFDLADVGSLASCQDLVSASPKDTLVELGELLVPQAIADVDDECSIVVKALGIFDGEVLR